MHGLLPIPTDQTYDIKIVADSQAQSRHQAIFIHHADSAALRAQYWSMCETETVGFVIHCFFKLVAYVLAPDKSPDQQ